MNSVGVGQELMGGRGKYNWTQTIDLSTKNLSFALSGRITLMCSEAL